MGSLKQHLSYSGDVIFCELSRVDMGTLVALIQSQTPFGHIGNNECVTTSTTVTHLLRDYPTEHTHTKTKEDHHSKKNRQRGHDVLWTT